MSNYLSVFLAPRVLGWLVAVLILVVVLTWLLRRRLGGPWRRLLFGAFGLSVGLVIAATLLRDPWGGACLDCLADWQWERVLAGRVGTDVWLNVVLFVPLAFFGTLLWRAPWRTAGAAVLLSLTIEIVQPLLGAGVNDLMDLIANGAGALIGAGGAAVLLLVGDAVRDRRLDLPRLAKVTLSVAAGVAVLIGVPAWAATAQQATAVDRLEEVFAGTTLADYRANRDGDEWGDGLAALWTEFGRPTMSGLGGDGIARERFTWNIYFAVRCVFAEWTPDGFAAVPRDGADCTAPILDVP